MPTALLDAQGWHRRARRIASPNCDARPAGERISLVVIHGISLPPGTFGGDDVAKLFLNRLDARAHPFFETIKELRVSAHFFVRRDGKLVQFVPTEARAWHAGVSRWRGRERCNDFSIGIELEGADDIAYTAKQYERLAALVRSLEHRYGKLDVAGHSDVAPGRKTDPGEAFEWHRLESLMGRALRDGMA